MDDILIEMISPKVKEIKEKFDRDNKLDNEDVQLLLLVGISSKFDSRYNDLLTNIIDNKKTQQENNQPI